MMKYCIGFKCKNEWYDDFDDLKQCNFHGSKTVELENKPSFQEDPGKYIPSLNNVKCCNKKTLEITYIIDNC